jgi:hypothetical protein
MDTNFKYVPYRNKKILQFAKGQSCQHCGTENGTTVAAHSNLGSDGKGIGKKADDCFVAFLCDTCHDNYDRKRVCDGMGITKYYLCGQEDFDRAMKKTWRLLLINGVLK